MALFLNEEASLKKIIKLKKIYNIRPNFSATILKRNFSPPPSFGKSNLVKYLNSILLISSINCFSKKGNRHSFPLLEIHLSSLPRFLIHNLFKSNFIKDNF